MDKVYIVPNATGPTQAVSIDINKCIACNACADICRTQTILPNPEKGQPPVVVYPDECWYCACCVEVCPSGALSMNLPINQRILFRRRETGEVFRIGQKNPPPKSYFKPPVGWMGPGNDHEDGRDGTVWKLLLSRERKPVAAVVSADIPEALVKILHYNAEGDISGKTVALLRRIGFDKVYKAEEGNWNSCTDVPETKLVQISLDPETRTGFDAAVNAADLAKMWRRACVSAYTASTVWDKLEPEESD